MHEIAIPMGGERRVGRGRVKAEVIDPLISERNPGLTEEHEAAHAVVTRRRGKHVRLITNIAEGNSLGHMEGELDPLGVAAPYALGLPGAGAVDHPGSDLWLLDQLGYDIGSAAKAARRIGVQNEKHIKALATKLGSERVVRTRGIDEVIDRVDSGPTVRITVEGPDGSKKVRDVRGVDGHHSIFVPVE